MKTKRSRIMKRLRVVSVGILCAAVAGWGALQSRGVQEKLLRLAEQVRLPHGMRLELSGPAGSWPMRPELAQVRVFDEQGLWLEAESVEIQWSFGWRRIRIREARILKLALHLDPEMQGPDLSLAVEAEGGWEKDRLHAVMTGRNAQGDVFSVEGEGVAPWSLAPLRLPQKIEAFQVEADGRFQLSVLNAMPQMRSMRVGGILETEARVVRSGGELSVEGSMALSEGVFEHFELGTVIRNMNLKGEWNRNRFEIVEAAAETPGGGRLGLQGHMAYGGEGWTGELGAALQGARLLHLDAVQAALSGDLRLVKNQSASLRMEGDLELEETTFHLDRLAAPYAAPLEVQIQGRDPRSVKEKPEPSLSAPKLDIAGAVNLRIPGSLRVEGKQVQSRWEGTLRTSLERNGLMLTGRLQPRRGNVVFFSRSFTLDRNGEILFSGLLGTPPILDLLAVHARRDFEARLRISGRAAHPQFQLASSPPYPETEIISRILFGKDMSTITGLQALEVGLALNSMRDQSRGDWDVMGRTRDALGVDQLEIRETGDEEGNPELMAGRQISDRVYLEVQQNLREPGTTMRLEVDVGRSVSIESESGTHIRPGIGVSWRKDY
ncbi:MAG: translocation/assembly module TamB domain-containing protein [Kiritimatiellia bacterium]